MNHVAPSDAAYDDGSDRSIAGLVEGTDVSVIGAPSMSATTPVVAPQVSVIPVTAPMAAPIANAMSFVASVFTAPVVPGASVARNVGAVAPVARLLVAREPITGIEEVCELFFNLVSL